MAAVRARLTMATVPRWIRPHYRRLQIALDVAMLASAFFAAYLLRFDFRLSATEYRNLSTQLPFVLLVQLSALLLTGVHHRVWRYTSLREVPLFLRAAFYSASLLLVVRLAAIPYLEAFRVPLSIIAIDTTLAFGGVLALRVIRRALDEERKTYRDWAADEQLNTIFIGAGRAGVLAVRELEKSSRSRMRPVGFVDDDPLKQDGVVAGLRVLGTVADLPELASTLGIDQAVITIADIAPRGKQRIVDVCAEIPLKVREIPGYYEVLQGSVSISRLRDIDPEEFLGRDPVRLDEQQLRRLITGKRLMVTGAGGSIGAELCRQICRYAPEHLAMVEQSEFALFEIARELDGKWPGLELIPVLADISEEARMDRVMSDCRPQVVVHAAAYKHVPMMEQHPTEAIRNNILGTRIVAGLAGEVGAETFILVSTDKAVRPTSVMGASKRVAELVVQDLQASYDTTYSAVRFGNVLGSAGSVIPIFQDQIASGGPVTITDPDMERYFMSIPEAAQLILRAGSMAEGGEIFVLDMGDPVRIIDLAHRMIRMAGFEPETEIPIVVTGRRRGEKLHEELGSDAEALDLTRNPKIYVGRLLPCPREELARQIDRLEQLASNDTAGDEIRRVLNELVDGARLEIPASDAALQG